MGASLSLPEGAGAKEWTWRAEKRDHESTMARNCTACVSYLFIFRYLMLQLCKGGF